MGNAAYRRARYFLKKGSIRYEKNFSRPACFALGAFIHGLCKPNDRKLVLLICRK